MRVGFKFRARQLGVRGFLSKMESAACLLQAIREVAGGGSWYSDPQDDLGYLTSRVSPSMRLTPRQLQVLRQLAEGLSYKEIGKAMSLSENTIDVYMRRIRQILGGHNGVDLIRLGVRYGFLSLQAGSFATAPETRALGIPK
jgi:two-component system, NarL family, invasion response regulator UvrY